MPTCITELVTVATSSLTFHTPCTAGGLSGKDAAAFNTAFVYDHEDYFSATNYL
jgi:hypothetical protein